MDVREAARVEAVQDPGGDRSSEVPVERGHRPRLDVATESGTHDVLVALPELGDERTKLAEVVSAVGVAHDHERAADEGERIDVSPTQATSRRLEDPRPPRQGDLARRIRPAVDDQHLALDTGPGEALL